MGITRAQIARQLLAQGGMPMKEIKGQNHMLAYITPNEANKLVRLGGQETMTPEGIPAYPEYDNYGYSNQADFDQGNYAASSDPTVSGYADRNMSDEDRKALSYAVKPTPKKTFAQKVVDSIKNVSNFTPFGIARKGLGFLFDKFQNLRGFNPNGTRRTQKQFNDARRKRQRQNRISNIMGRDAPFTKMTLENLRNLGYTGPLDGLLGSTNITRSGTTDQNFPDPVEGIVSQAPTFREAMAKLNLELGVPRDQVFSTKTATGEKTNPAIEGFKGFFGIGEGVKDYESLTGNRPEVEKALREGIFDAIRQDALYRTSPNFDGERYTIPETLQIGYDDFKGKGGATSASAYGGSGLEGFLKGAGNQAKGMYAALKGDPNSILNTTMGRSTLNLDPAGKNPAAIQDTYNFGTFLDNVASKVGGGAYKQDITLPEDFSKQAYDIYNQTFDRAKQVQNTGINQQIASLYR